MEALFHEMPADTGCSFVVVQHLSPDFRSLMDDLLSRQTAIKIRHAEHDMPLEADTIYLNPPKKLTHLVGGRLQLTDRAAERAFEQPINTFLESAAESFGPCAVAIILSGTGTDGTEGARSVSAAGGLVIVQEPTTAEFDGMPVSALQTRCADYVLAPAAMPAAVAAFARDPASRPCLNGSDGAVPAETGQHIHEFAPTFRLLKERYGLDFSLYKIATVQRRIVRRAALSGNPDAGSFMKTLESDPAELDRLYRDLLIGVTEFFRDPAAFAALRRLVYEPLLRARHENEIRVWVAGCATGEEAYSHAILLAEVARDCDFQGRIAIFATDAHRSSLEFASAGCYSADRLVGLTDAMRERYFHAERDGTFRVAAEIRQRVVFAPHNLLSDPPFTKMHVVSCRNLLIYLTPTAQERAISLLHYALRRGGVMMLGLSEGVGRFAPNFDVLDGKEKLFRKIRDAHLPSQLRTSVSPRVEPTRSATGNGFSPAASLPRGLLHAYDQLLARHLPPGFIIHPDGGILHYIGDSARFLDPQHGLASDNILARTHGDLRLALSTLLPTVQRQLSAQQSRSVRVDRADADSVLLDIVVTPLSEERSGALLLHVALTPVAAPARPAEATANGTAPIDFSHDAEQARRIADLEQELVTTKDSLQSTVEELQATNEELQAANEEMLAANEELQSTNEELHSVNEELYTVNAEFERKNTELNQTVADLDNLLGATDAGTLFLDRDLRIRRFNPAIQATFNLLPQDLGRSIEHIAYHLSNQTQMIEEARRVIETGQPSEAEERTRDGRYLLRRILPFHGNARAIEGVVLTFTRIDLIKEMQTKLDLAMASARLVWWEWDLQTDRLLTHASNWCILGYSIDSLTPTSATWFKLTHPDDLDNVRQSIEDALAGKTVDWECEHRLLAQDKTWRWVLNKGRIIKRTPDGRPLQLIGTTQDIHHRKVAEFHLRQLSQAIEQADAGVMVTEADGTIEFVNTAFLRTSGYEAADVIGRNPRFLNSGHHPPEFFAQLWATISRGDVWRGEIVNKRRDGDLFTERVSITPLRQRDGRITHFVAVLDDITALKVSDDARRRLETQLLQSQKMETLGTLAGGIAHDFNNLLTGILGYASLARGEVPPGSAALTHIDAVDIAARRAADLVHRILAFSRHHAPTQVPIVAAKYVRELALMLRPSLPATIELVINDQSEDASVIIDPVQFEQVVMNLCTNAAQAIGTRQSAIRLDLTVVRLDEPQQFDVGSLAAGRYLRLTIADNGPGIPPEVLPRIFDPFFTTKDPQRGTGLGLAIVQNIVTAQGGAVAVQSTLGVGTVFSVYLPLLGVTERPAALPPLGSRAPSLNSASPVGPTARLDGVTVFVVDDEQFVADLTKLTLETAGAKVTAFYRPEDCFAALTANPAAAQLLVTDQIMPGISGSELIAQLRAKGCTVPALLVSGYSRGANVPKLQAFGSCRFLTKPFERKTLLAELTALLATASQRADQTNDT
ncbi:MAG: PAS domain S-box protein [Opitutae bacterium]|nr:PAS domain S-box protein [Opitutae bacterium]